MGGVITTLKDLAEKRTRCSLKMPAHCKNVALFNRYLKCPPSFTDPGGRDLDRALITVKPAVKYPVKGNKAGIGQKNSEVPLPECC